MKNTGSLRNHTIMERQKLFMENIYLKMLVFDNSSEPDRFLFFREDLNTFLFHIIKFKVQSM